MAESGSYDPEKLRRDVQNGARQDSFGTRFTDSRAASHAPMPFPKTLEKLKEDYVKGKIEDVLADMPGLGDKERKGKADQLRQKVQEGMEQGTLEEWEFVRADFEEEWRRRGIDPNQKGQETKSGGIRGFVKSLFSP